MALVCKLEMGLAPQDVGERYEQLLKGEQSELKATPEEVQQLAAACQQLN